MNLVRTIAELRQATDCCKVEKGGLGLVPTMGAFHDGHLSLFRAARAECDAVVVSLFVNPAQFAPHEDLSRYPRDEARDAQLAEDERVDILFAPPVDELYPTDFRTWVDPEGTGAEGARRPDHFRGVATVCVKLFNIVRPQVAYFGQKDAQQAAIVRQLIRDLNLELDLRVIPTVRDPDGLALSSRNAYLSADERLQALVLPRALRAGRDAYTGGADPVAAARAAFNGLDPDYVEVLDLGNAKLLAAAARVGETRLIDNVVLEGELR
jgi:pantoate--beta-alanine ligase